MDLSRAAGAGAAVPAFDWTQQPREQLALAKYLQDTNYLQMAEGAIDSAHTRFLHRGSNESNEAARRESVSRGTSRPGWK